MAEATATDGGPQPGADNAPATALPDTEAEALFATFADAKHDGDGTGAAPAAGANANAGVTETEPQAGATGAVAPAPAHAIERAADQAPQVDWSKVDPAVKAVFDAQAAELATTQSHLTRARGQQSRFARELLSAPTVTGPVQTGSDGKPKPTPRQTESPEFKKLETDYPEVAAPLKPVLDAQDDQLARLTTTTQALVNGEVAAHYDGNAAALMARHPDYLQLVAAGAPAKAFQEWAGQQPQFVKDLIQKNAAEVVDVDAAADVMDRYKAHLHAAVTKVGGGGNPPAGGANPQLTSTTAAFRQRQLSATATTSRAGSSKPAALPEDPEKQFDYWATKAAAKMGVR